jgi:AcrR family transcriptional regulator
MTPEIKQIAVPGSPQWWSTRPQRLEKSGGRGRPSISFDKIIDVALEAVDEVGPEEFNMRMLADRLASGTATLYRHVASKDEILAYVVDRVIGELPVDTAAIAGLSWQQACMLIAMGMRRMFWAHPKMFPLLVSQIPVGPNGLRARERGLSMLLANGFTPALAARAYLAVVRYVVGFESQQYALGGVLNVEDRKELGRFFSSLDPETFPSTVTVSMNLVDTPVDEEFRFGLQLIIDGLDIARSAKGQVGR